MTISVGDKLPEAALRTMTAEGVTELSTEQIFAGRKVVLFAVPGAFTRTCSQAHLPGFLNHAEAIKGKGVDTIACLSVNDIHVMDAWAKSAGNDGSIMFLADGNGDFTRAVGLEVDLSHVGFGVRSKRYAMIVEDGTVTWMHVDAPGAQPVESGGEHVLSLL